MELRRSKRLNEFFPVTITDWNIPLDFNQTESCPGRIINISRHGVCLLLPMKTSESLQVGAPGKAVRISLELEQDTSSTNNKITLTGYPVWMDFFMLDDLRAIKIGIKFTPESVLIQTDNFPKNILTDTTVTVLE